MGSASGLAAVEARGVVPYYQPIINPITGEVEALEVLSRIRLEDGSLLVADAFVAIAEKMGLMHSQSFSEKVLLNGISGIFC